MRLLTKKEATDILEHVSKVGCTTGRDLAMMLGDSDSNFRQYILELVCFGDIKDDGTWDDEFVSKVDIMLWRYGITCLLRGTMHMYSELDRTECDGIINNTIRRIDNEERET